MGEVLTPSVVDMSSSSQALFPDFFTLWENCVTLCHGYVRQLLPLCKRRGIYLIHFP